MYAYGEGVTQDFTKAYIWSAIAATRTRNEELHKLALVILNDAAEKMTTGEIENAKTSSYERYLEIEHRSSR